MEITSILPNPSNNFQPRQPKTNKKMFKVVPTSGTSDESHTDRSIKFLILKGAGSKKMSYGHRSGVGVYQSTYKMLPRHYL